MKIGFSSVFSFRPHVEHLYYLSTLVQQAGHEPFFMTCDSSVDLCYNRILKQQSSAVACSLCMLGGIRSYPVRNIFSADRAYRFSLSKERLASIACSTSYSLHRIESPEDVLLPEVLQTQHELYSSIEIFYGSARAWISKNKLDAVFLFNGRMDLTRALIEAAKDEGIPYISVERPWLGHGIQLNPMENCIGLKDIFQLSNQFKDKPLTKEQADWAAKLLALRYDRQNTLEWRIFNPGATSADWPIATNNEKILFTPGSRAESAGHPDFSQKYFEDNTQAFDNVLDALGASPSQCVLRCHPIWGQKVGHFDGEKPLRFYSAWAKRRGIHTIMPDSKADTYDLIRQADIVVVTGGSTGVEAAALGKKVICLGPNFYTGAGVGFDIVKLDDVNNVKQVYQYGGDFARQQVLRFFYTYANRYPQYTDYVRAIKPTKFHYHEGADPERLEKIIRTGSLEADDVSFATSTEFEKNIIEQMKAGNWKDLASHTPPEPSGKSLNIGRRFGLGWLDHARDVLPPGDRL